MGHDERGARHIAGHGTRVRPRSSFTRPDAATRVDGARRGKLVPLSCALFFRTALSEEARNSLRGDFVTESNRINNASTDQRLETACFNRWRTHDGRARPAPLLESYQCADS